ncbi:conserved hypothetical protein [uncultured Desulfatiglans sp.]|uniref:MerR HTH family regulatory protein n=1 Tax=Uncultured Desulfatiglans sp. TaxID=1748965 RepID=A0A653A353_UNCDX|nr:conserved hypothetical protein [uncultured Desulfatiglans sp.]
MTKEYWTITEVIEAFELDEDLLSELESEEIVCPICTEESAAKLFSAGDLETLRLTKIFMEDMGVNLPGVEVILRMRQNMIDMRRQFDAILEELAGQLKK